MSESVPKIRRLDPAELGPPPSYTQVVEASGQRLVFISGQTAFDAAGTLVGGSDCEAQAGQVFRNLAVALAAVGGTAANIVKLTVFVRNMDDLAKYRAARDRFFAASQLKAPAVTLVEVSRLYAPELLIEIEAIAVL
jgi:enamine deaminase RidA (YjgF/YER057c/UK114 family)